MVFLAATKFRAMSVLPEQSAWTTSSAKFDDSTLQACSIQIASWQDSRSARRPHSDRLKLPGLVHFMWDERDAQDAASAPMCRSTLVRVSSYSPAWTHATVPKTRQRHARAIGRLTSLPRIAKESRIRRHVLVLSQKGSPPPTPTVPDLRQGNIGAIAGCYGVP